MGKYDWIQWWTIVTTLIIMYITAFKTKVDNNGQVFGVFVFIVMLLVPFGRVLGLW